MSGAACLVRADSVGVSLNRDVQRAAHNTGNSGKPTPPSLILLSCVSICVCCFSSSDFRNGWTVVSLACGATLFLKMPPSQRRRGAAVFSCRWAITRGWRRRRKRRTDFASVHAHVAHTQTSGDAHYPLRHALVQSTQAQRHAVQSETNLGRNLAGIAVVVSSNTR